MNKNFRRLIHFAAMAILVSSCSLWQIGPQAEIQTAPATVTYETLLGKPIHNQVVVDFLAQNLCTRANQFLICKEAGMALWTDSEQVVEIIYLYLNNADGFIPYKGKLPFGLRFYDTMGAVEYKLKQQGVGNGGRPDSGGTPDHLHYQATYKQAGLSILYNSPFADEDANIYAILLSNGKTSLESR